MFPFIRVIGLCLLHCIRLRFSSLLSDSLPDAGPDQLTRSDQLHTVTTIGPHTESAAQSKRPLVFLFFLSYSFSLAFEFSLFSSLSRSLTGLIDTFCAKNQPGVTFSVVLCPFDSTCDTHPLSALWLFLYDVRFEPLCHVSRSPAVMLQYVIASL